MPIMYRTDRASIEARDVERQTAKFVYLRFSYPDGFSYTVCETKMAYDHAWFDTWPEAHAHLVGQYEQRVADLERRLEEAKVALSRTKELKEPE